MRSIVSRALPATINATEGLATPEFIRPMNRTPQEIIDLVRNVMDDIDNYLDYLRSLADDAGGGSAGQRIQVLCRQVESMLDEAELEFEKLAEKHPECLSERSPQSAVL